MLAGLLFIAAVQAAMWDAQYRALGSKVWGVIARWSYNVGVLNLLAAVALLLVPPATSKMSSVRTASVALLVVGFLVEMWWIGLAAVRQRRLNHGLKQIADALAQTSA